MYNLPLLKNSGLFENIDIQFGGFMAALSEIDDGAVPLAAAITSRSTRNGDVCIELAAYAGLKMTGAADKPGSVTCPPLKQWRETLLQSKIVGEAGEYRPMILDGRNRLYLYRFWEYEKKLADFLLEPTAPPLPDINAATVKAGLERLFPEREPGETDWRKIAAIVAMLKRVCIISGGPGTGKTFAVARILAFLLEQHADNRLKILLAAPTGKAASRLTESICAAKATLTCANGIKAAIPDTGQTIHRMLKSTRNASRFRYHAENKLPADVVVVDEASMVDLPLMSKLVQALSAGTRLLLLGDRDQLASVEAGSVMGDICGDRQTNAFSTDFRRQIKALANIDLSAVKGVPVEESGFQDRRIHFSKSYRFDAMSGIPELSRLVNSGRAGDVVNLLKNGSYADIKWFAPDPDKQRSRLVEDKIVRHYGELSREKDPAGALAVMNRFKILCVLNHGPYGVRSVNRRAIEILGKTHGAGYRHIGEDPVWYHGRPVLIRKNDYRLELYNGDMGIAMRDPHDGNKLAVFFTGNDNVIRRFPPFRLPMHETAYAITIHKSQGSEFDDVLLMLPEKDTPILTRELVYTGITRARRNLSILCSKSAISSAVSRQIARTSGLRDKIEGLQRNSKSDY
ncbi:MAG: exodeoxyribonuclease V subunit alpha [Deltaproteobacteria bacterium]|nr:exodeoxyribonuclease V subunit alpha [Deltaproteobacteria bacterium]